MFNNLLYAPSSYKEGPTLNVFDEVRESGDFNTPNTQLALVAIQQQTKLASLTLCTHDFNRLALWKRSFRAFYMVLTDVAHGFIT